MMSGFDTHIPASLCLPSLPMFPFCPLPESLSAFDRRLGFAAAVEIGGGPWDSTWTADGTMKEPLRSLVQLPVDVEGLASALPGNLKPPGL